MPGALRTTALQMRSARRLLRRGGVSLRARLGPLDERVVFVIGSPRSGTTFLGRAIGSLPGFVDLGEVAALKAATPVFVRLPEAVAAERMRRLLAVTRRLGLVAGLRPVEQTPEVAFVVRAAALAFPQASFVHIIRDGRDVVCSLLERGWLRAGKEGGDDAGLPYGAAARFWVESGREEEFGKASDAARAAWAWRRYTTAAREAPADQLHEIMYERLSEDPQRVAAELAAFLHAPSEALAGIFAKAHGTSIGRWKGELTAGDLEAVEIEAGSLLRELGYGQRT